jgi:hypothetical protein
VRPGYNRGDRMKNWLRRLRGALGVAVSWAVGWAGVLSVATVVIDLLGGYGWTPTLPNLAANAVLFGAMGFLGGVSFSVVLAIAGRRRRFEEMSLPTFTGWGVIGGIGLGVLMALTSVGGFSVATLITSVVFGSILGGGSAGGSLILARKADAWRSVRPGEPAVLIEGSNGPPAV